MGKILVLAVAAAFYPTLLAIVVLILTRPQPVRLLAGFLIGGMTVSITVGLVILGFADTSNLGTGSTGSTNPIISLVVGALLIGLALLLITGRDLPGAERRAARKARKAEQAAASEAAGKKDPWSQRMLTRDSFALAVVLGAVLNLPSVWYLEALREIDVNGYATVPSILLVLLFNLIMFALIEIPLAYYLLRPERAAEAVASFDSWTRSNLRGIGIWVAAVAGAYLAVRGVVGLL